MKKYVLSCQRGYKATTYLGYLPERGFRDRVQKAIGTRVRAASDVTVTFRLTAELVLYATISCGAFNSGVNSRGIYVSRAFHKVMRNIEWGRVRDFTCTVAFVEEVRGRVKSRYERREVV